MGRKLTPKGQGAIPDTRKVLYPIHEGKQMDFMTSPAEEILYGGAAGGGKSFALRAMAVSYCLEHPGATAVLFRRTYRELEDTHIKLIRTEVPSYIAEYTSHHDLVFKNGSVLMFRFCEQESDVYAYDTFEADIMLFDELTAFTSFQYSYLITRCRSTKPWWPGRRIRSATNPGNTGHNWVKERFIDYLKPMEIKRAPENEGGLLRQFIPAKLQDNPTLMKIDPTYENVLKGLPYEEYRAKALGDWEIFSGQFFRRWRKEVHVIPPFQIPPDWQRYIGVDYGIHAPHAVYWAARPPDTNHIFLYREQYGADIPAREQARMAAQKVKAFGEKIEMVIVDPSMAAKSRDQDGNLQRSLLDIWKEEFAGIADVIKGNNERIQGAALFREVLDWQGIETSSGITVYVPPRLHVMEGLTNFIRTVPALMGNKLNVEDVDTNGEDHAYDAVRYLLRYLFAAPVQPKAMRYYDTVDGIVSAVQ
ncbi:MAG: phage terminase large subunit [Candidatus Micrarchaeota archaeon]|nr:phage terminase large subunit [Candidatus Micrarchaeota archaeon]